MKELTMSEVNLVSGAGLQEAAGCAYAFGGIFALTTANFTCSFFTEGSTPWVAAYLVGMGVGGISGAIFGAAYGVTHTAEEINAIFN